MTTRRTAPVRSTVSKSAVPARVTRAAAARSPGPSATVETPAPPKSAPAEKAKARKPLVNRNHVPPAAKKTAKVPPPAKQTVVDDGDREPIKAFLRIRPNIDENEQLGTPYLKSLSATTVQMSDVSGTNRIRLHPQAQIYTFNHIFPPETLQAEFFTETTLPLVRDLLSGQNSLIFTYGVTNSGKTYTIQGGSRPGTAGLLPRTLDVVFNSLEGLQSNIPYRPVRLAGVEHAAHDDPQFSLPDISDEKAIADALGEMSLQDVDSTTVKVDKNYEYSIWISYAEVYNEKVYDLLSNDASEEASACATPQGPNALPRSGALKKFPRSTSTWSNLATLGSSSVPDILLVKRKALALKNDPESAGKYVAGLKCVRVRSTDEAKRVFRTGNINRRVFGTLANAVSSRSHGIFTLRVVRVHRADHNDVTVSRLSIVDLAGSERTKNTQNTGERLKEAGSINKSLMVLGQCMEAMRTNQRRLAASLAAPGRGGLDLASSNTGVKLAIVPFRHSKLTELFQDFFVGERDGRAVMIVNVNPYDTGFDENSHVMRFAALAREVTTVPTAAPHKASIRQPPPPTPRTTAAGKSQAPHRRKVTISTGGVGSRKASEAHLEIVEEDEEADDDDDEPADLLVDALFEELEDLRIKLYESEMRCAVVEAETREEVMHEMEMRMLDMERIFAKRLMHAVEQNDAKTDAKIDMLHQFGAFNGQSQSPKDTDPGDASFDTVESGYTDENSEGNAASNPQITDDSEGEGDEEEDQSDDPLADSSEPEEGNTSFQDSARSSPLQHKSKLSKTEKKKLESGPSIIGLRDQDMAIDEMDADETMTIGDDGDDSEDDEEVTDNEAVGSDDSEEEDEEEDEEDWVPSPQPTSKWSNPKAKSAAIQSKSETPKSATGVSGLQKKLDMLSLFEDDDDDDNATESEAATVSIATNLSHDKDDQSDDSIPEAKKKKRQTTKTKASGSTAVRRSARHTKN